MDSDAAKSRKKSKLFPCFRSAASGCPVRTERCKDAPDEKVFPLMAAEERDGTIIHSVPPLASSTDVDDEDFGRRKRKGSGGALSRAIKAVLFGTALAKKIRKKKAKQKQNSEKENRIGHQSPSSISNGSRIASDLYQNYSVASSRTSMPFSSSFCSSPPSSSDISERSFPIYPNTSRRLFSQINLRKFCSGWLLLLVCVLCLVLWGKLCAIVCTSAWILCFSCLRIRFKSPDGKASAASAINSGEYKKRIVIEGLLARDRSAARNSSSCSSLTH